MTARRKKKTRSSQPKNEQRKTVNFETGEVLIIGAASPTERLELVDHMHIREVDRQCSNALRALDDIDRAVRSGRDKDDELWYAAQALTVAVANLSKILLGTAARRPRLQVAKERAARLRKRLGVSADAPWLLRDVRNGLEHFDERLDEWGEQTNSSPVSDRTVVRKNYRVRYFALDGNREIPAERWREYNVVTDVLSYQGQELRLSPLREELPKLQAQARKESVQRPVVAGTVQFAARVEGLPAGAVANASLAYPHDPRPVAHLSVHQM